MMPRDDHGSGIRRLTPAEFEQVEAVFAEASGLDAANRHRLLDGAFAERADLRREVEALLAAHDLAGGRPDSLFVTDRPHVDANRMRGPMADADKVGRVIAHYQLVEPLGAGGMGEVFRARDLALGRDAALKLLPRDFDPELRIRLLREAEASARLQHPAIATFYEAGDADDETFIAMEFVPGRTLRERLRDGPLPAGEALAMAGCLLEALAHAHAAGLLHRDIKPENIILSGAGTAKLLDFSIALPIGVAPTGDPRTAALRPTVTSVAGLAGTIGYFAPEQASGRALDVRTDVFQVGAVLYEAMTARRAFGGSSLFDHLATLLSTEPDFEVLHSTGSPPGLIPILRRALARDPAQRHPTAAALLRELHDLAEDRVLTALPKVLSVFDFVNHAGDDGLEWLGAALAESIRVQVSNHPDVSVLPRARLVDQLRTPEANTDGGDPLAAAQRLGCSWLVVGSVERRGGPLQMAAQLIEVATGTVAVEERAEGPLEQLFVLQDRLARGIATALGAVRPGVSRRGPASIEAYEYYTRARVLIHDFGKTSLEDAIVLLERAIDVDPHHVDSLAALTMAYGLRAIASPNRADYEAGVAFADRALALDPRHVRAHVWRAYSLNGLGRSSEVKATLTRALEIDPADTEALYFSGAYALLWTDGAHPDDAVPQLQRALEQDDGHGMWWLALGTAHRCLGHLREARYSFARAQRLEAAPAHFGTAGAAAYVGETLRREGRLDEARRESLAGVEAAERSDHAYRDTFRAHALTVLGRVALDQRDMAAAAAAFHQVLAQARGRPRPRACGHFVVQALCGLARATGMPMYFEEAAGLFESREAYNFSPFYGALDEDTLAELALAAAALGRTEDATRHAARARDESW
jgi:serine/threonine-protein kinase